MATTYQSLAMVAIDTNNTLSAHSLSAMPNHWWWSMQWGRGIHISAWWTM